MKGLMWKWMLAALLAAVPAAVFAQGAYPTKPIRLIVAFEPGGSTDIIARLVGQKLSERVGHQVVVDNRGGAGGTIGTEIAARAPADGYTLTMGTTSTHVIAPAVYPDVKYDPVKDFTPITGRWRLVIGAVRGGEDLADLTGVIEGEEAISFAFDAPALPTLNVVELDLPTGAERLTLTGTGPGEVRLMMACLTPLD